jgi:gas vesicle protein
MKKSPWNLQRTSGRIEDLSHYTLTNSIFYTGLDRFGKCRGQAGEIWKDSTIHPLRQLEWFVRNPSCGIEILNERGACMREGKYRASEEGSHAGTAVTFLLIGLGAGALVGLLLAPKTGKQMRKDLRRKYESAKDTFEDWAEDAKEFAEDAFERGSDIAEEVRDRGGRIADEVRDRVAPLAKNLRRR